MGEVTIPKLGSQWKISFSFQPRGEGAFALGAPIRLLTTTGGEPVLEVEIFQHRGEMELRVLPLEIEDGRMELEGAAIFVCPVTVAAGLTKSEITHERDEEGKYTLTWSVGDKEVDRKDMDSQILRNLTNIKPNAYDIDNVIVLDKP